jgi:transposase
MVPCPEELPDDVEALKKAVISYARKNELLQEQNRLLMAQLYERKSERLPGHLAGFVGLGLEQLLLFGFDAAGPPTSSEDADPDACKEDSSPTPVGAHERCKPKRQPLPAHLPRVEILHDIPEAANVCGCGATRKRISAEHSEQLDFIRPEFRVLHHVRPKYACQHCQGVHGDGAEVPVLAG